METGERKARVAGTQLAFGTFQVTSHSVVSVRRCQGRMKDRERVFTELGRL
jgi:hypothetical protein